MMRKGIFWGIFTLILLAAVALRFYKIGQIPFSTYWDETAMMVDVKSVLQTGKDIFGRPWFEVIYPSYGDFKLPVYIWLATLSAKIFGLSQWSFRLPSELAGIGTIVVSGFLAKFLVEIGDEKIDEAKEKNSRALPFPQIFQLSTMAVIAFSPWAIMFSRTGFEGHVGQFFLATSMLFVLLAGRAVKKSQARKKTFSFWIFLMASPVFGALATYTYFSVRFVWPVIFVMISLLAFQQISLLNFAKGWLKKSMQIFSFFSIQTLVLPLIVFAALMIPMIKSPLYGDMNKFRFGTDSVLSGDYVVQSNIYREMGGNSRLDRVIFSSKWLMARELLKNYSSNLSFDFLFIHGDPNLRHGTGQHGLFLLIFFPFLLFGMVSLFVKKKWAFVFLVIWWLVALLPASVPNNVPHALRSLNALVPVALLISWGVARYVFFLLRQFQQGKILQLPFLGVLVPSSIFFFMLVGFTFHYFTIYPSESATSWQDGYVQLSKEIFANRKSQEAVQVVPFDDRFYLWLMLYGPYTGNDFHSWKSEQYQFQNFDNITFRDLDPRDLSQLTHPLLVAGQPEKVLPVAEKSGVKPQWQKNVLGSDGQMRFVIMEFGK